MKVAMVTIYPSRKAAGEAMGGVAAFAAALAENLAGSLDTQMLILAQKSDGREEESANGVRVRRIWSHGGAFILPVIKEIRRARPDLVHLQHEVFLYGGILSALKFPALLALLRMSGQKTIVTIHGVPDPNDIDKEFTGIGGLHVPSLFVKIVFKGLFRLIARLSRGQIVHDESFRRIMIEGYGAEPSRVTTIPLPYLSDQPSLVPKEEARTALGIGEGPVALLFGYISKYKGVELLIDGFRLFAKTHPDSLLIIAGGLHPRLKEDAEYLSYYNRLKARADEALGKNVIWKGFVPEDEIDLIFSAIDLCVLPYVKMLSFSGPAMLAMARGVPLMVSEAMAPLFSDDCPVFEASPQALSVQLRRFFDEDNDKPANLLVLDEFQPGTIAKRTRDFYEAVLRETTATP
ncbi:MAG: hypothetical protein A2W01_07855 [Candidatus Solincola sediminis]|nr:MAG: hypothetical protein A2W01_07855 [Candidatus Solincola sediminis]